MVASAPEGWRTTLEKREEELLRMFKSGLVSCFDASYHDVVPHERLVYSYVMPLADRKIPVSLTTMQIRADDGGTAEGTPERRGTSP